MTNRHFLIVQQTFLTKKSGFHIYIQKDYYDLKKLYSAPVPSIKLFQSFNKKLLTDIILASSLGYFWIDHNNFLV